VTSRQLVRVNGSTLFVIGSARYEGQWSSFAEDGYPASLTLDVPESDGTITSEVFHLSGLNPPLSGQLWSYEAILNGLRENAREANLVFDLLHGVPRRYRDVMPTATETFWPFVGLRPALWLKVIARATGSCWTGSIATTSARAWRCMSGNEIYDPCFAAAPGPGNVLVCDPDPVSKSAVLLRLTKRLPTNPYGRTPGSAWFVVLANGARCSPITGTNPVVRSIPLTWGCSGSSGKGAEGSQIGVIDGVAVFAYSSDGKTLSSVPVVTEWIT